MIRVGNVPKMQWIPKAGIGMGVRQIHEHVHVQVVVHPVQVIAVHLTHIHIRYEPNIVICMNIVCLIVQDVGMLHTSIS
jgi:hypothetical protein